MKQIYFPLSLSASNVILLPSVYVVQLLVVLASHVALPVFTYCLVLTHADASVITAFTVLLAAHVVVALVTVITGFVLSIFTVLLCVVSVFPSPSLL